MLQRVVLAALLASVLAVAVPSAAEAHVGVGVTGTLPPAGGYPWGVPQIAGGLAFGVALGLALIAGLSWARFNWSRGRRLVVLAVAVLVLGAPSIAWGWSLGHPKGDRPGLVVGRWSYDSFLGDVYNGPYGGLTVDHHYVAGGSGANPCDILEAAGYMVDLKYTPDGKSVDSFTLETLQKRRFTFLVRPEIVPVNWDLQYFQVYRNVYQLVAVHFTKQDVGNVAIELFEVSSQMDD